MVSVKKIKEYFSFFLLITVFLISSFRYFPGRWLDSLIATLEHVLSIGPLTIGATIVIASILQKMSGERMPWKTVFRIFLGISIGLELIIGISNYYDPPQQSNAAVILYRMIELSA